MQVPRKHERKYNTIPRLLLPLSSLYFFFGAGASRHWGRAVSLSTPKRMIVIGSLDASSASVDILLALLRCILWLTWR